jgi:protoporphyrinogen IX oxidase
MSSLNLWLKVLHILAVISWMAGMLYLPRLFVYHAQSPRGSEQAKTFVLMEGRLMRVIMLPAMLVAWLTGIALMLTGGFLTAGWLHGKLALVIVLSAIHGYFARLWKDFRGDSNRHGPGFYRVLNEVPTVLLVGIVILVVFKPF